MTFAAHWQRLLDSNPALSQPNVAYIKLTPLEFRRLLEAAHASGVECGKAEKSLFESIFRETFR